MSQLVNKVGTRSLVGTLAGSANQLRHCMKRAKEIIATNNWYAKTLGFPRLHKKLAYVIVLISANTTVEVSMKKSTHLYTAVSHLIKYDYSLIELYNVIFRKTDVFSV